MTKAFNYVPFARGELFCLEMTGHCTLARAKKKKKMEPGKTTIFNELRNICDALKGL